jgi:hypothetical protein
LFKTLSKYFGFDLSSIGTTGVYDEWEKVKSILDNDYNILNLSSLEITKKYNYYDPGNMCGILTRMGIKRRTHLEALNLAISNGNWNIPEDPRSWYKHGWYTTWNNKQVYYRSSLEKQVCDLLDLKKIDYDMESKRIKYLSTKDKLYHVSIPDFYLPKYNLILEAKGSYFYDEQDTLDRFKTYIDNGYDFRFYLEGQNIEEILNDLI